MELEKVKEWDDLTGKQKYAVCVGLGGIDRVKMLLRNELKVVLKNGKEAVVRTLSKLVHKATTMVRATSVNKDKFYGSELGFKVWTSPSYDNIVKKNLPTTIIGYEHRLDVFELTENMRDSQMLVELSPRVYCSVAEVAASQLSRIMMWSRGEADHGLLLNGYANIDHGVAEDGRVVAVRCHFGESARKWYFDCDERDGHGDWDAGLRVSGRALGA